MRLFAVHTLIVSAACWVCGQQTATAIRRTAGSTAIPCCPGHLA